jgi:acetyl-CoA carboxylase carboxyl transferase subunit beta
MPWFGNIKSPKIKDKSAALRTNRVPEGMWDKCKSCGEILEQKNLRENLYVCPECSFHMRVGARERIEMLLDEGSFVEHDQGLYSSNPLEFFDLKPYPERLEAARKKTGLEDALISGEGTLSDLPAEIAAFEFKFMGGSMGTVVGEKITRTFERALEKKIPAIVVTASGGARMQEGILSLMQMAKTSALVSELKQNGIPYISILTDPTTGGVAASFALQGDVILAEPKSLIGFAGPRVIQQTIRQELPEGFQRAEFLLEHGFLDMIVERSEMKSTCARLIKHLSFSLKKPSNRKTKSKKK